MDLFKTKRSPARGWLLVLGALTLVGAAALLSSCSADEEEPSDEEHAISVRPGKKTLKSPKDVEEELKGKGETITLTIDKEYEKAPDGTWEHLLQIIEKACKDEDAVEDEWVNGYWLPKAKKTVRLDLSATSLAVYSDSDKDGIYDGDHGYGSHGPGKHDYYDNYYKYGDYVDYYKYDDNDDNDGGVVVFDPRIPIHYRDSNVNFSATYHYPYKTGEPYITELTLPDKATAIPGTDSFVDNRYVTFKHFTRLAKVTANGVEIINGHAFDLCVALEEASFPKVEGIGYGAFGICAALTRLYLPADPPKLLPDGDFNRTGGLFTLNDPPLDADTLTIYVNGGDAAVDAYVDKWEIKEAQMPASSTEVYCIPGDFYYHKRVTIMPLK